MIFNNHEIIVPDVSFYQDNDATLAKIDFVQMKHAGAWGVILRAGQNLWVDEDYADYRRDAKVAGLPRGYYFFYDSRAEPGKQASTWRAAIGNDLPEIGLWCDFEDSYNGPYNEEKYWKQFLLAMEAFYPSVKIGVYTADWWWRNQSITDYLFWGKYPLWVAQYTTSPEDVILPRPWILKGCVFWQFTSHGPGIRYGVESFNIDLSYFNGTEAMFMNYFDLLPLIPPDPPTEIGDTTMYEGNAKTTNTQNVNVRKPKADGSLDETGMIIGAIRPGQAFKGDRLSPDSQGRGNWIRVTEVGGNPINGWSAGWLLDYHEVTPPPPATEEYILHVKDGVTRKFILAP